jgi:hypothetical protein
MEVGEMEDQFTLADALRAQENTVRRLRARVLRYAGQVEGKAAAVAKIANDGNFRSLNDLGELQQLATGFDAAIAALYTASEALETFKQVLASSPGPLDVAAKAAKS